MKDIKFKPTDRQAQYLQTEATRLGITRQELLRRILDRILDEAASPPVQITVKENPADLWAAARKFIISPPTPGVIPQGVYLYAAPSVNPWVYDGTLTITGDSINLPCSTLKNGEE